MVRKTGDDWLIKLILIEYWKILQMYEHNHFILQLSGIKY